MTKSLKPNLENKNAMRPSLVDYALEYANRGWPVIPLHTPVEGGCSCSKSDCNSIGKHPRTKNGLKNATTDEKQIRAWWKRWPAANIGILTGAASGFIVLDVDHGGEKTLDELQRQNGPFPKTMESITGGGGMHILFAHPGGKIRNKVRFAEGLDIRGDGGYIVAPPSLHKSGKRYEWRK